MLSFKCSIYICLYTYTCMHTPTSGGSLRRWARSGAIKLRGRLRNCTTTFIKPRKHRNTSRTASSTSKVTNQASIYGRDAAHQRDIAVFTSGNPVCLCCLCTCATEEAAICVRHAGWLVSRRYCACPCMCLCVYVHVWCVCICVCMYAAEEEENRNISISTGVCKIIAHRATVSNGLFFSVAGYCL
jgi:hypothetical protein